MQISINIMNITSVGYDASGDSGKKKPHSTSGECITSACASRSSTAWAGIIVHRLHDLIVHECMPLEVRR
jgi:hypothetical protein